MKGIAPQARPQVILTTRGHVMLLDEFIIIRHSIICYNCHSIFTSMSDWMNHRAFYPDHRMESHAVSIVTPNGDEDIKTFPKLPY